MAAQMEDYNRRVGARIRADRERRGIEPRDLAYELGVDKTTVERWERGERRPQLRHVKALADHFDKDVEYFRPDIEGEERALREQLDRIEELVKANGERIERFMAETLPILAELTEEGPEQGPEAAATG